jgi:hypothetical protein
VGLLLLGHLNNIYSRLRREEIKKAKVLLKKIETDIIFDSITKSCWKNGIQFETLMKNREILEIKLKGRKEAVLFRFHKIEMIFLEDYERFVLNMEVCGAKRGIYITTGVFEGKILKNYKKIFPFYGTIKIIDNFYFIKSQLGFFGTSEEVFKRKNLKLFKYLPI